MVDINGILMRLEDIERNGRVVRLDWVTGDLRALLAEVESFGQCRETLVVLADQNATFYEGHKKREARIKELEAEVERLNGLLPEPYCEHVKYIAICAEDICDNDE